MKKLSVTLVVLSFCALIPKQSQAENSLWPWVGEKVENECFAAYARSAQKIKHEMIDPYFQQEQKNAGENARKVGAFLNSLKTGSEKDILNLHKRNAESKTHRSLEEWSEFAKKSYDESELINQLLKAKNMATQILECPTASSVQKDNTCGKHQNMIPINPLTSTQTIYHFDFSDKGPVVMTCVFNGNRVVKKSDGSSIRLENVFFCSDFFLISSELVNREYVTFETGVNYQLPDGTKINGRFMQEYIYDEMPRKCFKGSPENSRTSGGGTGNYRPTTPDSEHPSAGGAEI